jgi:hypothetical protein
MAQQGARGASDVPSGPSQIRLGLIIAQTGGSYTVGLVGADASVGDNIPGVRAWGDASFAADDKVFLIWVGDRPIPFILAAAGGSGSGGGSEFLFTVAIFGG